MSVVTPANVLAFAPLIEGGVALVVSYVLARPVDAILKKELSADSVPNNKIKEIGKDTKALADLKRYLGYGSRVGQTLETSVLAIVSIILSGYEHSGTLSVSGLYLVVLLLIAINLVALLLRLGSQTGYSFRPKAAAGHYTVALLLSFSIILLNISLYPKDNVSPEHPKDSVHSAATATPHS